MLRRVSTTSKFVIRRYTLIIWYLILKFKSRLERLSRFSIFIAMQFRLWQTSEEKNPPAEFLFQRMKTCWNTICLHSGFQAHWIKYTSTWNALLGNLCLRGLKTLSVYVIWKKSFAWSLSLGARGARALGGVSI